MIPNGTASIGLGTTTPWAYVSIGNGNGGTKPLFVVASSTGATATTTVFIVDTFGNVGIGTSSPSTGKLEVNGLIYSGTGGYRFPDGTTQTTAAAGGGGYSTIQDEGSGLTQRTTLNFTGSGVSCVDNGGNTRTDCTVNAGAATAGGVDGQIQFNNSTALGGANVNYNTTTRNLGVGTTTPWARMSIAASNNEVENLFAIGSSTGATATSTVFIINKFGEVGIGTSTPVNQLSVFDNSAATAVVINQQGTGALLALQQNGTEKFSVGNNGGVTISAVTSDIVKSTTGTAKNSDFSLTGSTFVNTLSTGDAINLNDSTTTSATSVGAGMFQATATTTFAAMGAGGHVIIREDGKYVVIHGGGANVSVWNGYSSTMTALAAPSGAVTRLNGNAGAGSISLRRPDGRYLVIHGGGVTSTTILDPYGYFPSIAGPTIASACTTGTNAFQRPDGRYVILCGGFAVTSVYDPTANTFTVGPVPPAAFGAGAHAIMRDNGTFLVFAGGNSPNHSIYNPNLSTTNIGAFTRTNPITVNAPTITTGAFSIRRTDGKFIIMGGAVNTSTIYDSFETGSTTAEGFGAGLMTSQSGAGFGPTTALADGAQAIWRQDGTYLLFIGAASGVTNIIDPSKSNDTQFTAGQSLPSAGTLFTGATAVMRSNGQYAILGAGANSSAVTNYDMGYVIGGMGTSNELMGSYETECMVANGLNPHSTLVWHTASEGTYTFQVKTGTGSCPVGDAAYETIQKSGDNIKLDLLTDNRIQVKVSLQRSLPKFFDQEWNIRKTGQVRYRRNGLDPVVYDFTVDNGNLYKRNFIDFASNVNATSSATSSIPITVNLQVKTDGVGLAYSNISNPEYNTTVNSSNSANFNGAFATSTPLNWGIATSTIVMKRPDGKFVIINGSITATTSGAQVYNPDDETITNLSATTTGPIGAGALAFKRQDGKFVIVLGNSTGNVTAGTGTTTTNIFDPITNTFTYGPPLTGNAGRGALVIPLPTGKFLIAHGSITAGTTIYDPFQNSTIQGPVNVVNFGPGSMALPRPDGTYLIIPGATTAETCAAQTVTEIFDPAQMQFRTNTAAAMTGGTGPGAFAFQRTDGLYVIFKGGITTTTCLSLVATNIYNPITNRMVIGPSITAVPTGGLKPEGSFAMPMANGSWMVMIGGASTTARTNIYLEKAGVELGTAEDLPNGGQAGFFIAGPTNTVTAVATSTLQGIGRGFNQYLGTGPGAIAFQRPDGKFLVIAGSGSTTASSTVTSKFDAGWVSSGLYKTEQIQVSDLDTNSVLNWKVNPSYAGISAEVRTATSQAGLQTASARSIAGPGQKINPGAGETWLQVTFNFKREFPSYTGVYTDVWYNGATPVQTQRTITQPILTEISVTKDIDFLNLQADGIAMLRISSNGNVYAADGATFNSSGADLAERYTSQVPLENGEVVAIDPQNNHSVMRTLYRYQPNTIGVVSTDPGFVAGAYTKNSYPIALIGRVPVKVSTENGTIRQGDYLTPSSVPGHAMKATLAGHVIGKALESLDETKLKDCPASDIALAGRKCGTVMMFVNLVDYLGSSIDDSLALKNRAGLSYGAAVTVADTNTGTTTEASITNIVSTSTVAVSNSVLTGRNQEILEYLEQMKTDRNAVASSRSELFADKGSFVTEVVTPTVIARMLKADSIEGLTLSSKNITTGDITAQTINTGSLSLNASNDGFFKMYGAPLVTTITTSNVISTSSEATSTDAVIITLTSTSTTPFLAVSFDALGNGFFAGLLTADVFKTRSLTVSGTTNLSEIVATGSTTLSSLMVTGTTTLAGLDVRTIGLASSTVDILSDATFIGRPYFTKDTGGRALIRAGKTTVEVVFEREYVESPIVGATISLDLASTTDDTLEEAVLAGDVRYVVTKKSVKGFTIRINKAATSDIAFDWMALAVKGAALFTSKIDVPVVALPIEPVTPVIPMEPTVPVVPTTVMVPVVEINGGTTTDTTVTTGLVQTLVPSVTAPVTIPVTETQTSTTTISVPEIQITTPTTTITIPVDVPVVDSTQSSSPVTSSADTSLPTADSGNSVPVSTDQNVVTP